MLLETVSSRSENKIKELRNDGDEKQRSIEKLQHALESYRSEVKGLEGLVISMELEHKEAMTKLRSDMDEAVADLECHVAAETRGRREAEEESEQRFFRIRELEAKERDLQAARNEKQRIIRSLEEELEKEKQERESEVGSLNVRIGELSSNLSEARADLVKMEAERARLVHRVEQEKLSAEKVVEKMREELKLSMDHLETIRDSYHQDTQSRGQEVLEHNGLLTPTSAVRFRGSESCEGHVVMTRGKSRKKRGIDSGIGILEEDQDEEMMM
jgi:chromosome segregation ATPase